ncbi:hypothetical protein GK047_01705 [Paenibacillus sp. SYP-B3998]|uniref:Uncharacterized protein n=1 Tax=Paenibacillus sp. SYP-B3998 TaxID=2678564 RepID=A0A6G3ZRJ0_9BACL|nr:hypothetical protein [Paenibacillus sp. SYP-B3998]NEW04735.1 hypothetical protein [Paenibacillus sp. SYP-B3998]
MATKVKKAIGVSILAVLLFIGSYLAKNTWSDKSLNATTDQVVYPAQLVPDVQAVQSPKNSELPAAYQKNPIPTAVSSPTIAPVPTEVSVPTPANEHSTATSPKPKKEAYSAEVTHEKAAEVKDEIPLSEQMKITAILLKKLSASDLKLFQNLFDSGMSLDEKKKAKQVIMEKLTEKEYDELIAIASKYGLSKGKSYEESLQEKK